MKKLYYVANIRMPSERAHSIQIAKMCESFADAGAEVELVVPRRKTLVSEDSFQYYRVKRNFKIIKLWCLDWVKFGWLGFWIESLTFLLSSVARLMLENGIYYTRDEMFAIIFSAMGKDVIWEAHMGHKNLFIRMLIKRKVPMVAISRGLRDLYTSYGAEGDSILVSPDAVSPKDFNVLISKEEAREELGIKKGVRVVMYTGSLLPWKGVGTLEKAGEFLKNVEVLVVSGKPYSVIPTYLRAADLLVIPNTAKEEISRSYTSPMKLFEYMASGTPAVIADLPSLREIVDETECYFFAPDSAQNLASIINKALSEPDIALKKAALAQKKVGGHTWGERGRDILKFAYDSL